MLRRTKLFRPSTGTEQSVNEHIVHENEVEIPVVSLWLQDGTIFRVDERDTFTLMIPDWMKRPMLVTRELASLITVNNLELVHESVWVGPSWKEIFHFIVVSDGDN